MPDPLEAALREANPHETTTLCGPPPALKQRLAVLRQALAPDRPRRIGDSMQVVGSAHPHESFALESDAVIGTAAGSGIRVQGDFVSRQHCSLRHIDGQWLLEDNDSTNGLFVNGEKVESRFLCDGDIVQVGSVPLVFLRGE